MIPTSRPKRGNPFSRSAIGFALLVGTAGALVAQPAFAKKAEESDPKISFSSAFAKAAGDLAKALSESSKNAAVQAELEEMSPVPMPAVRVNLASSGVIGA